MRLKDIMLKDVSKATKEEIKYINDADLKRYVYRKNGEIEYVFSVLQNGNDVAVEKYFYKGGKEVLSSFEEMDMLKDLYGYDVEKKD